MKNKRKPRNKTIAKPSSVSKEKLSIGVYIFGLLSFVPFCGFLFGLISIVWGFLTKKSGRKALVALGLLGIIFGAIFYSGFMVRLISQSGLYNPLAESNLTNVVHALEFYKIQNGNYPEALDDLINDDDPYISPAIYSTPPGWDRQIGNRCIFSMR